MWDKFTTVLKNKFFLLALVIIIGLISSHFLGHDNVIEEKSEDFIKQQTDIEIDLTPTSVEALYGK